MGSLSSTDEVVVKEIVEDAIKDYHASILPFLGARPLITGGDTPIGAIEFFDDVDAPDNWVKADGSVLNIADYPFLASHYEQVHGSKNFYGGNGTTTFAVPDLQGEFLRGSGTNSHTNQGSGANVGVHQDGTIHTNIQKTSDSSFRIWVKDNFSGQATNTDSTESIGKATQYTTSNAVESTDSGYVKYTSRPTNTSFLICIKAVPAGMNYSTEEQEIGTWIDGKPLYQIVIDDLNVTPLTSIDWTNIVVDNYNTENIIDCRLYGQIDTTPPTPTILNYAEICSQNGYIRANGFQVARTIKKMVMQYTKTTD